MGARTGSRRSNSSSTSTARQRTRSPASSAVAPRRPWARSNDGASNGHGKARTGDDMVVRRKMEELSRLVPRTCGGDGDEADELLLRAAGYIARLQAQVTVMQLMVDVLEHTED